MCKTLMHYMAEAVTAYAMRDLKKKTEMIRWHGEFTRRSLFWLQA